MKIPHPWRGAAQGEYVGDNAPKPAWLLVVIVTISVLTIPTGPTVAGADTLVAVSGRTGWLCRVLQCRLEIPRIAILIERQAHHAPELPRCRLDILRVEVRVAARIGRCCVGCNDGIECLAAGAHDEFPYALPWIGIAGRVERTVAGIEVVVPIQHQVGSVLVEQLPKGLSGRAFGYGDAVGSAERGLVPVGGCARGMIRGEIVFQPFEFGSKPGARAAARLCLALYIERDKVPRAQIIGIPAISDPDWAPRRYCVSESARLLEVPRLSIRIRHGLSKGTRGVRVPGNRSRHHGSIGVVLDAVEVGEVAVAGNADCP